MELYNEVILILRKTPPAKEFWTMFARSKYCQQKEIETRVLSLLRRGETEKRSA
jgi:hypothetical protein